MSQPKYTFDVLFSTVPVTQELTCFFCTKIISPLEHEEYFWLNVPDTDNPLSFHIACFEEMAWMMFTYFHTYIHKDKKVVLQ